MPKPDRLHLLTASQVKGVRASDKLQKLTDGSGLHLWIYPKADGRRVWRLSFRLYGKQRTYTIGSADKVTLKAARVEAAVTTHAIRSSQSRPNSARNGASVPR